MASLVALIYNWWHLYARLFDGEDHREAITSRPELLGGVARRTRHSGQKTVEGSLQHKNGAQIAQAITMVSSALQRLNTLSGKKWHIPLDHGPVGRPPHFVLA